MPLIVEDGTGREDANSYIDLADARELASMRGISLSADDTELTQQLVNAADRLNSYECRFSGERTTSEQGLSYPRMHSKRFGKAYPDDAIPKELKLAQVTLGGYINAGVDVWASTDIEGITREKVGPIETEYDSSIATDGENPYFAQIDSILSPLFTPIGVNFLITR